MSMEPHRFDLEVVQGATFYLPFAIEAPDGTTYDLATVGDGYTIGRAQVRDLYAGEGGELLLSMTTDNGGIVISAFTDTDGNDWSGYLFASATATAALVDWGEGVWDLEISDGTRVERPFFGVATLRPEVTV
jgi:hypothetical protein